MDRSKIAEWPTWRTVKLGTFKSVEELLQVLSDARSPIPPKKSSWSGDVLRRIPLATEITEVDLVLITVAELGFPDGATFQEICEKARSLGLLLCPAEVGLQLSLQYGDPTNDEAIFIAMEPIWDSGGCLGLLTFAHHKDGRWLFGFSGNPDDSWDGDSHYVFCRPKSS